jgi:deoxyribodipyrimidine photolyase
VGELRDIGYLHNHARLWFASIWVFTLGLPWQLGADFFLRYLLDGFLGVKKLPSLLRGLGHPG